MKKSMALNLGLMILISITAHTHAGSLEPPAGPNDPDSAMYTIEAVYQRLLHGTDGAKRTGAFTEPPASPAPTMHDMNEVMAIAPSRDDSNGGTTNDMRSGKTFWGLTTNEWGTQTGTGTRTLSADTSTVNAGYYAATNLSEVDTDLVSTNIREDVNIFGVTGTVNETSLPKTGQTATYTDSDDGDLEEGVVWPSPRFTIGTGTSGTNLVTDNLTGLMWARNANLASNTTWATWSSVKGTCTWNQAFDVITNSAGPVNGANYGGYDDWRLPNVKELLSLIHWGYSSPSLSDTQGDDKWTEGNPFTGVLSDSYWTSTTCANHTTYKWFVSTKVRGGMGYDLNTDAAVYVWAVRGP